MRKSDGRKKGSSKRIRSRFRELITSTASLLGIITFLVLVIIMLVIFISEQETNSKINTLFDAFWYTLVTITTVGYGDITPDSVPGRIAAMVLLIAGVALFGALSGKFASFLFDRQQKRDKGLLNMAKMKNHFLICGWKPNFERILAGILNANPEVPNEKIVILNSAGQGEIDRIKSDSRFKGINYLHGDFTDEDTLLKAQIKTAERALILADLSELFCAGKRFSGGSCRYYDEKLKSSHLLCCRNRRLQV